MEAIFNSEKIMIGDVEKSTDGVGWFATLIDESYNPISESFHLRKRDAIAWLKSEHQTFLINERPE